MVLWGNEFDVVVVGSGEAASQRSILDVDVCSVTREVCGYTALPDLTGHQSQGGDHLLVVERTDLSNEGKPGEIAVHVVGRADRDSDAGDTGECFAAVERGAAFAHLIHLLLEPARRGPGDGRARVRTVESTW